MIRHFVERVIARLKREPGYRLAPELSTGDLLGSCFLRFGMALRGSTKRFTKLRGARGIVFVGKRVTLRSMRRFTCGAGTTIEEGVSIWALSTEGVSLGCNVTLARDAILQASGVLARPGVGMKIGDRVAIGAQSFLGGQGGITIGDDTIMGPGVRVFSEEHVYDDPRTPIRLQGERRARVVIGANCWIGANVTILSGTQLGEGCVVAAGAVVKGTFPENALVVGVPARTLRHRAEMEGTRSEPMVRSAEPATP